MEVVLIFLTTTLPFSKTIYKQLTLLVIHRLNSLAITPNPLHPSLVLYLVSTIFQSGSTLRSC